MGRDRSNANEQPPSERPSTIYRLIWQAVRARKQITCIYGGRYREACPHILGYKKLGQEAVFVFQFGGDTTSKLPSQGDWRCLDLAGVTDVQVRAGRRHSGTRHTKTQTCIQRTSTGWIAPALPGARSGRDARFIARPPHRTVRAAFPHTAPTSGQ